MRRAQNRAVPIRHEKIIAICQPVGTCLYVISVHAGNRPVLEIALPAPRPFSPFSSSSSKRKFRGIFAPIVRRCTMSVTTSTL